MGCQDNQQSSHFTRFFISLYPSLSLSLSLLLHVSITCTCTCTSLSLSFSADLPFDEGTDSDGVEDDDDVFTDSSQAIKNKQEVTLILYTKLTIK